MSPRRGYRQSEEHIRKRTEARRGGKLSEEHKRKISESMKGRGQSEAQMGRALSERHKRKLSEAKEGKSRTELADEMVGLMSVQTEYFLGRTYRFRIEIIMLAYDSIFRRRREKDVMFYFSRDGLHMTVKSYILALLDGQPVKGNTKVVHQLFLIAKEIVKEKGEFRFFPHMFGPYSNVVAQQFNSLIDKGHVKHSKVGNTNLFELTDSGREILRQYNLDTNIMEEIQSLKKATANHRIKDMLDIIRVKYPEYLVNEWI